MNKYTNAFAEVLGIPVSKVSESLSKDNFDKWDSMFQLTLATRVEQEFDIFFEPEDIMGFTSYDAGIKILSKYGIML